MRRTDLDRLRPDHDIRPTALGRYDEIWRHIEGHRAWLESIRHHPVSVADAVEDWYEHIYCPIVTVARERGVMDRFPDRTEADVYLWVTRHRWELERQLGRDIGPEASAADYADHVSPWRGLLPRVGHAARALVGAPVRLLRPRPRNRDGTTAT